MTKREKQLQLLRRQIKRQEHNRELGIKLLVRATLELPKLRKQEARLETTIGKRRCPVDVELAQHDETEARSAIAQAALKAVEGLPEEPEDNGGDPGEMPKFLQRTALAPEVAEAAHAVANAHNAPPTEEQKKLVAKEKRKVKEEHKHAELTGKKRKWPATGRAAVAAIRSRSPAT